MESLWTDDDVSQFVVTTAAFVDDHTTAISMSLLACFLSSQRCSSQFSNCKKFSPLSVLGILNLVDKYSHVLLRGDKYDITPSFYFLISSFNNNDTFLYFLNKKLFYSY